MSAVRVKICGITRLEDALLAARLGADALGFNFWPGSKRYLSPADAGAIIARLPPLVVPVGVFVNQPAPEVLAAASRANLHVVQLHGDERPAEVNGFPLPVIKAVRVAGAASLRELEAFDVRALLLDAPTPGFGGGGVTFDWDLAAEAARRATVILAGGLTPENVGRAVRLVRPYGVDVASGVESSPGVKDPDKLRRFIENARKEPA